MEAALNESESILGSSSAPTIEPSAEIEVESGPVASPTAVAGVEENVNSRFIDYSIATPWEDLIASIERVLRSWKPYVHHSVTKDNQSVPPFSVKMDYNGTTFRLDFMLGSSVYTGETKNKQNSSLHNKVYHYFYHQGIPLWFTVRKYVLLTRHNGTILGESERRLMFSALISALDASQVQVPAFVSASPLSSMSHSLEILGYMIKSPREAEITLQSPDSVIPTGPKVIHFESQTLSGVGSKHAFFYLDGLMRLFETKLWKFSRGHVSISDDSTEVVISAVEFYEFRYVNNNIIARASRGGRLGSRNSTEEPGSPSRGGAKSSLSGGEGGEENISPVVKCTLDDLLVCYPNHPHNLENDSGVLTTGNGLEYSSTSHHNALALINSSNDYKQAHSKTRQGQGDVEDPSRHNSRSESTGSRSSAKNIDPTLLLQAYQQQQSGSASSSTDGNGNSSSIQKNVFQVPLEKISIQVYFRDLKQGSVVDNDYYTTLLPSKLPPSAWGAKATFAPTTLQSGSSSSGSSPRSRGGVNYLDILSPPSVSPLLATSLRRLLALYVCGKSARSDSTFRTILESLETYGNLQGCISTDRAIDISSILSLDARRAVVFLCASASQPPSSSSESSAASSSNSTSPQLKGGRQQDLLMRVFSRSLWVDEEDPAALSGTDPGYGSGGVGENLRNNKKHDASFANHPTWNWLQTRLSHPSITTDCQQVPSSAPVGSWLSLVSVYTSSFESVTGMATFWQECLEEVRVHWENRVPIPRLYPPVPIIPRKRERDMDKEDLREEHEEKNQEDEEEDAVEGAGDASFSQGVWLEPLWGDLQTQSKHTATPFELPDLQQNLPHQKLQMVNMCIICGEVGSTVGEQLGVRCVTKARQQLKDRLNLLQELVEEKVLGGEEGQHQQDDRYSDIDEQMKSRDGDRDRSNSRVSESIYTSSNTTATTSTSQIASLQGMLSMNVSSRDLSHVTPPRLQRRLPMTSDALAQHRHLANKLRLGSSRSATENSMLRWQILYPELISDVRAFKGCNNTVPSSHDDNNNSNNSSSNENISDGDNHGKEVKKPVVTFADFVVWYGGAGVSLPAPQREGAVGGHEEETALEARGLDGISLADLKDLWDECGEEGLAGPDQKPLFKAEQEAEKALGYLEGMTIVQIARTLLSSALPSMHMLLTYDVQRCHQHLLDQYHQQCQQHRSPEGGGDNHSPSQTTEKMQMKTIFDPGQELAQDLEHIAHLIRTALHDLHLDTPLMGTTASKVNAAGSSARAGGAGNKEEAVNQQALLSLDEVCAAISQVEILLMKIESASATLEYHPRLVGHIARYGYVTATTEAEAKIILSLAKCASFGQDSHSWHSYDGRELGIPKKKIFDVRCQAKNSLFNKTVQSTSQTDNVSASGEENRTLQDVSNNIIDNSANSRRHEDYYDVHGDDESWANVDYFHGASASIHSQNANATTSPAQLNRTSQAPSHQMMVVLEEGSLRVAFRLQEDDV